jgi:CubicO group peptidase (beta-lactamase class C family)
LSAGAYMAYDRLFGELQTTIPILIAQYDVPALSIAVVERDHVIWQQAFGFTEMNGNHRVTPDTLFSIQSISKSYVALGFLIAVEKGKVSLDESIKTYLPQFRVRCKDNCDYSSSITFRHLLSHRSGLPHEAPMGNNYTYADFSQHIKSIQDVWLKHTPGQCYSYSNLGFDLIGYILQVISDRPFTEYMKETVFHPLGMERSTFDQADFLADASSSVGHDKVPLKKEPISMVPAGGMYSTALEMAKFVSFLLTEGRSAPHVILRPETLRLMYACRPNNETEDVYCLGVDVSILKGSLLVNHNGGGFGFLATQDALIGEGLGVIALTNSVNHPNIQHTLSRRILSDLVDCRRLDQTDGQQPKELVYSEYIGLYGATYNGGISKKSITLRNGDLFLGEEKLTRHSGSLFFTDNGESIEIKEEGAVISNVFHKKMVVGRQST